MSWSLMGVKGLKTQHIWYFVMLMEKLRKENKQWKVGKSMIPSYNI